MKSWLRSWLCVCVVQQSSGGVVGSSSESGSSPVDPEGIQIVDGDGNVVSVGSSFHPSLPPSPLPALLHFFLRQCSKIPSVKFNGSVPGFAFGLGHDPWVSLEHFQLLCAESKSNRFLGKKMGPLLPVVTSHSSLYG